MRRAATLALAAALLTGGSALALPTQTWISGVGDDANPCSRTAPCLTLQGAYAKAAVGGEINYLDPVEAGALTINHSITINGAAAGGGAQVEGQDAILVAAGATDVVVLHHLTLIGDDTHGGVHVTSVGTLQLDGCELRDFNKGVDFEPSLGGQLLVSDSTLEHMSDSALLVASSSGTANATVSDSQLADSARGILALAGAQVSIVSSTLAGNSVAGAAATLGKTGGSAQITLFQTTVTGNGVGVTSDALAGSATVRLADVVTDDNGSGPTHVSGTGVITSLGNNAVDSQPTLALDSWAAAQMVASGSSAFYPITVGSNGVNAQPITLACTGLPAGATCQFSPGSLPGQAALQSASLTVTTGPVMSLREHHPRDVLAWLALLPLLALAGGRRRRLSGLLALALSLSLMAVACSGGSSTMMGEPDLGTNSHEDFGPSNPFVAHDLSTSSPRDLAGADLSTPAGQVLPGTYTFQVTATSGHLTALKILTLTVY